MSSGCGLNDLEFSEVSKLAVIYTQPPILWGILISSGGAFLMVKVAGA
jgi:hypothetical protein